MVSGMQILSTQPNLPPVPASAVEEHRAMKRKDPGSTPDEGSEFLSMKRKIR